MRPQHQLVKDTTFTIKGLNWMDDYNFRVIAENRAGIGPANELTQGIHDVLCKMNPKFDLKLLCPQGWIS